MCLTQYILILCPAMLLELWVMLLQYMVISNMWTVGEYSDIANCAKALIMMATVTLHKKKWCFCWRMSCVQVRQSTARDYQNACSKLGVFIYLGIIATSAFVFAAKVWHVKAHFRQEQTNTCTIWRLIIQMRTVWFSFVKQDAEHQGTKWWCLGVHRSKRGVCNIPGKSIRYNESPLALKLGKRWNALRSTIWMECALVVPDDVAVAASYWWNPKTKMSWHKDNGH